MKKYIYILLTFCLLISCMEDPTVGVVVPKYTPSTENPGGPGEEPGDGLIRSGRTAGQGIYTPERSGTEIPEFYFHHRTE